MAVIGICDLDFWARGKSYPNLELMQIFHYYWNKGDIVNMMSPKADLGRYNHIYYFKEQSKTSSKIPENVDSSKSTFYGTAIFGHPPILKEEVKQLSPLYLPYDNYPERIWNETRYRKLKNSNYIRLKTQNFSDLTKDRQGICFADLDLLSQDGAIDFMNEHKNIHKFFTLAPLSINSWEDYQLYTKFASSFYAFQGFFVDFDYDINFLEELSKINTSTLVLETKRRKNETEEQHYYRVACTIMWFKHLKSNGLHYTQKEVHDPFIKKLSKWATVKTDEPFLENNTCDINYEPIKDLLSLKPSVINKKLVDFSCNL